VIAVLLTLNERQQEERSRRGAEEPPPPISRVGQPPAAPPPSSAAQAQNNRVADGYPPPSAPYVKPTGAAEVYPLPSEAGGARAVRPPFAPHQVRLRRDVDLLRSPDQNAPRAEPVVRASAGMTANAIDERDGWYLLETSLARGWAPIEAVEEP
jgi:hypothetical protein